MAGKRSRAGMRIASWVEQPKEGGDLGGRQAGRRAGGRAGRQAGRQAGWLAVSNRHVCRWRRSTIPKCLNMRNFEQGICNETWRSLSAGYKIPGKRRQIRRRQGAVGRRVGAQKICQNSGRNSEVCKTSGVDDGWFRAGSRDTQSITVEKREAGDAHQALQGYRAGDGDDRGLPLQAKEPLPTHATPGTSNIHTMTHKQLRTRIRVIENARGAQALLKMKFFAIGLRCEGLSELAEEAEASYERLVEILGRPAWEGTLESQEDILELS
eukprot:767336-Hanusia_phi.AAC.7